MTLPSYLQLSQSPEFAALPTDQKRQVTENYWTQFATENPDQADAAARFGQSSLALLDTNVEDAAPIQKRLLEEQRKDALIGLAAYEGVRAGEFSPEQAQAFVEERNASRDPLTQIYDSEDFTTSINGLTTLARDGAIFTPEQLARKFVVGEDSTGANAEKYNQVLNATATKYGLPPEELANVVQHRLNAQEAPVSRDTLGTIHIKPDVLFQGKDAIESAIKSSDLPNSVKSQELENLDDRLTAFKTAVVTNTIQNHPEFARNNGIFFDKTLQGGGTIDENFKKIGEAISSGRLENEASAAVGQGLESAAGLIGMAGRGAAEAAGFSGQTFAPINRISEAAGEAAKTYQSKVALGNEINEERLKLWGTTGGTIGSGVYSIAESALVASATGGMLPTLSGAGRLVAATNRLAKVAPVATIFGARQGFQTYDQAIKAGKTPEEAEELGWRSALIEGGTTALASTIGLGGVEDWASGASKKAFTEAIKSANKEGVKAGFRSLAGEEIEELFIAGANAVAVESKINPNMTTEDLKKTFYDTALATLAGAGPTSIAEGISTRNEAATYTQTTDELEARANDIYTGEDGVLPPPSLEDERDTIQAQLQTATGETREALQERLSEIEAELPAVVNDEVAPENIPVEPQTDQSTTTPVDEPQMDLSQEVATPERRLEQFDSLPPIPEDHIRLMHQTSPSLAELIKKNGLDYSKQGINATTHSFTDPSQARDIINSDYTPGGSKGVTLFFDIPIDEHNRHSSRRQFTGQTPPGILDSSYIIGTIGQNEPPSNTETTPSVGVEQAAPTAEAERGTVEAPTSEPEVTTTDVVVEQPTPASATEEQPQLGLRKSLTTQIRRRYGLTDPGIKVSQSDREAIEAADSQIEGNPEKGRQLVVSLADSGRPTNKTEAAILNHELVRLNNELERAEKAIQDAPDQANTADAIARADILRSQLNETLDVIERQGSSAGLRLQAQKLIRARDYSLEGLQRRALAAKNRGATSRQTLTKEENDELKAAYNRIKELEDEQQGALVDQEIRLRKEFEEIALRNIDKELGRKPQKRTKKTDAEKKADLDRQIAEARKRIKDRRKGDGEERTFSFSDFTERDVVDAAIIATAYIRKGLVDLESFTKELVAEFGESARNFSQQVYDEAQRLLTAADLPKTPQQILAEIEGTPTRAQVHALTKAYVREGMKGTAAIDQVAKDLNISRNEASDLISGHDRALNPTRNELTEEWSNIRKIAGRIKRIEDIKNGVPKGKKISKEKSDEVKRLDDEIKELLKATKIKVSKDPVAAAKSRLRKEISTLEDAVAKNELIQKPQRTAQTDAELEALKAQRDRARKDYEEAFPEYGPLLENKERQILELQEAVRKNKMLPEKDKSVKQTSDLDDRLKKAKKEYNDFFKENGPKLTAKERKFLELQEALDKNILLPDTPKNKRQKTELDERISNLKKQYKEQFREQGTQLTPNQEIDRVVKALDKQIEREDKAIVKDLKEFSWFSPEISARRKALDEKRAARNEIRAKENAEKSAKEAISRLEEIIRTGNLPESKQRDPKFTPTQNLQVLWDTRNELQATVSRMRQERGADDRALKAAEKSVKDLERRIAERDFATKPPRQTNNPQVKAARELRDSLRKTYNELRRDNRPRKSAEDKLVDAINRRTATIRERIKNGDFSKKVKPTRKDAAAVEKARFEYDKAKAELDAKIAAYQVKNLSIAGKAIRATRAGITLLKMVKLVGDIGNLFRNVAPRTLKLVSNPLQWGTLARMYANGIRAGLDFTGQREYEIYQKIASSPEAQEFGSLDAIGLRIPNPLDENAKTQESGLSIDIIDRLARTSTLRSLGTNRIAQFTLALERVNRTFSSIARYESYATWRALKSGVPMTLKQAKGVAQAANISTGYGGFQKDSAVGQKFEKSVPFLNDWLTLSARWAASRVQMVTGVPVFIGGPASSKARIFRDAYLLPMVGRVMMGGMIKAAYLATKGEAPDDPEELLTTFNPWDSDKGGKMDFDGTQLYFDGGQDSFMSLLAKTLTRTEIKNGVEKEIKGKDLGRKHLNYWINRANPVIASAARTFITRENYNGEPMTWENTAKEWLQPIIASDTKKIFEKHGPEGVYLWLSVFHGAGLRVPEEKKEAPKKTRFSLR